ncbi:integrator complex subunit 12 [Lepisosteus oculatus]|uniref:integrator complex subunit 12 n=1 Tax=Lepisosteus oculatus TaxID=7918 RepID=UPI0035F5128D
MAATVSLELDPIFLKGLGYLHSKSKDSAEKLKALLDESLARGSDSNYRTTLKEVEVSKVTVTKVSLSKQETKSSSSSSSSGSGNGKSSSSEKSKKESEKRTSEKVKVDPVDAIDPPKKPRLEKQENRSSPITVQTSKDLPIPDLSSFDETSADDFAMEMGLACVVCRQMTVTSGNQLVECQECHNLYHQDCHKPQVTDKDVNDPRLVWYCARCTRQMKRMAQKTQKPPQKPAPAVTSAVPVVKDTLVKKPEVKPKQDTASTFQAFKRTEVKASTAVSGNPSGNSSSLPAASGLTGWAAFAAKTSTAGPASTKLGSSTPSTSGKSTSVTSSQKPAVGLSGLASAKSGLGSKMAAGNGNGNNGSTAVPLKPPPPLTLGKPGLNRSSSSDSVNKVGLAGPSSSPAASTSQAGSSGNGGSGSNGGNGGGSSSSTSSTNNNNGTKASADPLAGGKAPTSQESQLNAMKRLQMVKKKAAQKKLKK